MQNIIKYALVGLAGYLVGFYELKYKLVKVVAENALKEREKAEKESN